MSAFLYSEILNKNRTPPTRFGATPDPAKNQAHQTSESHRPQTPAN